MRNIVIVVLLALTACRYFPVAPTHTPDDAKKEESQSK